MSETIQNFSTDSERIRTTNANPNTPPAPLNQSRDVRQSTMPHSSTLQYSNQPLQDINTDNIHKSCSGLNPGMDRFLATKNYYKRLLGEWC